MNDDIRERGDILLFRCGKSLREHSIAWATHGPYVHTAICTSAHHCIGATFSGIKIEEVFLPDASLIHVSPYSSDKEIEEAVQWAERHRNQHYGWLDIVYQFVKFFFPNNPFQLVHHNHWDCSDFVTRYLIEAKIDIPEDFDDPYANTPNDIARMFGLLPARAKHESKVKMR